MSELQTGQQEIFDYVKNNLGEGMIDVELDPKHYQTALTRAIDRYRQRSSNAVEESYAFLELKENQNTYILPDEVINVRKLFKEENIFIAESGIKSREDMNYLKFNDIRVFLIGESLMRGDFFKI